MVVLLYINNFLTLLAFGIGVMILISAAAADIRDMEYLNTVDDDGGDWVEIESPWSDLALPDLGEPEMGIDYRVSIMPIIRRERCALPQISFEYTHMGIGIHLRTDRSMVDRGLIDIKIKSIISNPE